MGSRRSFLGKTLGIAVLATGSVTSSVVGRTDTNPEDDGPQLAWQRSYPDATPIQSVAPTGDGGFLYGGISNSEDEYPNAVVLTEVNRLGRVRRRATITPAESTGVGGETPCDLVRVDGGYALARGSWLALLDDDLAVRMTAFAPPGARTNGDRTFLLTRPGGFAVAKVHWYSAGVWTALHWFADDGVHQWTKYHDHHFEGSFLVPADRGIAVGGTDIDNGNPWIAVHDPDGTRRWREVYEYDDQIHGTAAVSDTDGLTVTTDGGLLRVGWDGSVQWRERFGAFPEVAVDQQTLQYVFDRTGGGYVLVGEREGTPEQYAISAVTDDLRREWHVEFEADGDAPDPITGIQPTSGTYLLGGGETRQSEPSGFALLVTGPDTRLPTATPTSSPTPSPTPSPSPSKTPSPPPTTTPSPSPTATASRSQTPSESPPPTIDRTETPPPTPSTPPSRTETTSRATEMELPVPGVASVIAAVAGFGTWLASRQQREE